MPPWIRRGRRALAPLPPENTPAEIQRQVRESLERVAQQELDQNIGIVASTLHVSQDFARRAVESLADRTPDIQRSTELNNAVDHLIRLPRADSTRLVAMLNGVPQSALIKKAKTAHKETGPQKKITKEKAKDVAKKFTRRER